jgi:iron complex transport system substrate-binding protein
MRIVSLLPSATEILCAVGGEHMLVGRSHECDFPPTAHLKYLPILTAARTRGRTSAEIDAQVRAVLRDESQSANASLYTLNESLLRELQPDVILTQDLCEVCSIDLGTVRRIASDLDPSPAIISLNPDSLEAVFDDMLLVGEAVGLIPRSTQAVVQLREQYWSARDYVNPYIEGPEVAFLEWIDPLFAGGHWTPQLIEAAGARHSLNPYGGAARAKSRQITPEELVEAMPERIIICPCGYDLAAIKRELPALQAQRWWPTLPAVMDDQVMLVDGNQMFNRPGPRLVDAYRWLVAWINDRPELIPGGLMSEGPEGFPAERWNQQERRAPSRAASARGHLRIRDK